MTKLHQIVPILLLGMLLPCSAAEQEVDGETSTILEKCLATAEAAADASAARQSCVGTAAAACMDRTPAGLSNLGMTECLTLEAQWWDKLLNSRYAQLKADLEPEAFASLQDVQRKWIAFKDADCQYIYDHQFGEGSMRLPVSASCDLDATALRALQLGDLITDQ